MLKKGIIVLIITVLFTGCVSFTGPLLDNGYKAFTHAALYFPADPLEFFGVKGKELEGRLFEVKAGGNAYISKSTVKKYAMWAAGKAAYNNGYDDFSILIEDGKTQTSLRTNSYASKYSLTTNTYEVEKHNVHLIILLLTENDYELVDNIYKASKYYQPGSTLDYSE